MKITSKTGLASGVYAELALAKPISVQPGKQYTLSVWTKSIDPGFTRIGCGSDWQYRATLPATSGKWRRISMTFTPKEADAKLDLSFIIKGVTRGLWLDDVKLEAGPRATLDAFGDAISCCPGPDLEITNEGSFEAPFEICAPRETSAKIEVSLSEPKDKLAQQVELKPGVSRIMVRGESTAADERPRAITIRVLSEDKEITSAKTSVTFYSAITASTRLDKLQRHLPVFKADMDRLKSNGIDVSCPQVSYTVLDNFIGYAREDAQRGEVKRSISQIVEMEAMVKQLRTELAEALAGKRTFAPVPRWTGDTRPTINGSSFIAPTIVPGKAKPETRPVFFTGYGHFAQVRKDIEKWPGYGTNIIQFEIGPWNILPAEGVVDDKPIKGLLADLDRAQKAGVAVNLLISPHYFPEWMYAKYPELRKHRDYFIPYCLHAPESQELLKRFISILIPPIKDHPALHSICISNEPRNVEEPCEYASLEWRTWLQKRHGDINTLNDRWGTNYKSFDEITVPDPFRPADTRPSCKWADFVYWNQEFFAGWHKMLADAVHAVAPDLPVHAKTQSSTLWSSPDVKLGNDPYLMGQVTNINGNDGVNLYSFGEDAFAETWVQNAMVYDLQRSVKDAPVFNSENHIILDRDTRSVPAAHIYTALWQEAIHGQSATTIWVWNRTFDHSSDFFGSIAHRPACARAVGIANCDLNRAAREVTAIQQAPAQVLILHSTSGLIYDTGSYDRCLMKLYVALDLSGVKVGFITERQLADGLVPSAPVIFIPNAKHLSNAAFKSLESYKGHLVMLGSESLAYDEFNKPRSERLTGDSFQYDQECTLHELADMMRPKLSGWDAQPLIDLRDEEGKPVWGVEWRSASSPDETLVNICRYGSQSGPCTSTVTASSGFDAAVTVQLNSLLTQVKQITVR